MDIFYLFFIPKYAYIFVVKIAGMKKALLTMLYTIAANCFLLAQGWVKLEGSNNINANAKINSICVDSGGILYAAGQFTDSTCIANGAKYVAKWNGFEWSKLGGCGNEIYTNSHLHDDYEITTVCVDSYHNLYAAGSFMDSAGYMYVAKWNGTSWSRLGTGSNSLSVYGTIWSMCIDNIGNVYVAGEFKDAAGYGYVAKWDGTSWSELGSGSHSLYANSAIQTICADADNNIYAAGRFMNSSHFYYVAKWDGANWSEVGTGSHALNASFYIQSICVDSSNNIYAGGWFTNASGNTYVAKWDGSNWGEIGTNFNLFGRCFYISSICVSDRSNIYAGGAFQDSSRNQYVAHWTGLAWEMLGSGSYSLNANLPINTICTLPGGKVLAAGAFTDSISSTKGHCYVSEYLSTGLTVAATNNEINWIEVYPNPASQNITITLLSSAYLINTSYRILDVTNKTFATGNLKELRTILDIGNLPNGVYILQVFGINAKAFKFIKQ